MNLRYWSAVAATEPRLLPPGRIPETRDRGRNTTGRRIRTWTAVVLLLVLVAPAGAGEEAAPGPSRKEALIALGKTLEWLSARGTDVPLGERGTDAFTWTLFARLHPNREVREQAADRARSLLTSLPVDLEATMVSLSWWALLVREMSSLGMDTKTVRAALSEIEIAPALADMPPTLGLWTSELLRHAGLEITSDVSETVIAKGAALGTGHVPSRLDAYAVYHELAAVTDLGRTAPALFSDDQLAFARKILPGLLKATHLEGDTDGSAEVMIAAALLDDRSESYYLEGMMHLLEKQRGDGTFAGLSDHVPQGHGVLVCSWALLEMVQN